MTMKPLYFDYNATTPVLPPVRQAMLPFLGESFGNPGSGHAWGLSAQRAVEQAREQVARLLGAEPGEIIFTSCATESDNLALGGILEPGDHLVTSAVEHPAITEYLPVLRERGVEVALAPVDDQGRISLEAVRRLCTPRTRLVSVMLANNETGTIQPVAEIAAWARKRGILVHSDAAQAVGKIPVDVGELGVDLLTVAGHKLYAPKGVGALYLRRGVELKPLLHGGGQERGLRPGTENVPHLVGLGRACALARQDLEQEMARQRDLGRRFITGLEALGRDIRLHAREVPRLPGTMSVGFAGFQAGDILSGLVAREVGASAGAACHGDTTTVSHVLAAMGVPDTYAHGTIRFSWGRLTTAGDVDELLQRLRLVLDEIEA